MSVHQDESVRTAGERRGDRARYLAALDAFVRPAAAATAGALLAAVLIAAAPAPAPQRLVQRPMLDDALLCVNHGTPHCISHPTPARRQALDLCAAAADLHGSKEPVDRCVDRIGGRS
jgi:hypothetical protein